MPRTKGAYNKMKVSKASAEIKADMDRLTEQDATTPELNLTLLKVGAGISLHTLIRIAAGDTSLEGLSTTNMTSAASKLLDIYVKTLGDEAFSKLVEESSKAKKEVEEVILQEKADPLTLAFFDRYEPPAEAKKN